VSAGLPGRLTPDRFGFAMPAASPPFDRPPYHYRDIEMLGFVYETDDEAAADIVPEGLVVASSPAVAVLIFPDFHFSTLGAYREVILGVRCLWEERPVTYCASLLVTDDIGELGGRDIYGYPKLLGHIKWVREHNLIVAYAERPKGKRLCTGILRPRDPMSPEDFTMPPNVTLKIVPSPEEGAPPEVCELVMIPFDVRPILGCDGKVEGFSGPGNVTFDSPSDIDPWYRLPVRRMVSAAWWRANGVLSWGKVIRRYRTG
jgi:acetoacetate decarboxylase